MKTKSFILVSVAVFAALVGGFLYVALSGGGDERRLGAAVVGSFSAANFSLEMNGASVGYLKSVDGCGVRADVVSAGAVGSDKFPANKHAAAVKYGPCKIGFGAGMGAPLYDWISDSLSGGKAGPKNVSIIVSDAANKGVSRLDLTNAVLTRFTMPALDPASGKEPLTFEVTLVPDSIKKVAAGGTVTGAISPKAKAVTAANFRFNAPGLTNDAKKLKTIDSWSFDVPAPQGGPELKPLSGPAELGNLTVTVGEPAADFDAWLEGLTKGNPTEKNVTVEVLDLTLKQVLIELNFTGAGLVSGDLLASGGGGSGKEGFAERRFSMYVQGAIFKVNAGAVG